MSKEQRDALDALLRHAPLDLGGDVHEQRAIFAEMMSAVPLPNDITTTAGELDGVGVVEIELPDSDPSEVIFYLHGGAYAIGSAELSVGLASDLARRANTRAVSIDYRLAPEDPYPAGLNDALAAYSALLNTQSATKIVIAGESAGAGLAAATLLGIKNARLPMPAAALLMSPFADLTLSGPSMSSKATVDPALTPEGLRRRVADYCDGNDPSTELISPIFGDLAGLPPLLIQTGSHEILLDDAIRLAAQAATADVEVTLEVIPGVPHVFQGFAAMLDEADQALTRAGAFIRNQLTNAQ